MAGIALLLDLCRKNPSFSSRSMHCNGLYSTTGGALTAFSAASLATGTTLASRFLFGDGGISVSYADAGAEWDGDYLPNLRNFPGSFVQHDSIKYVTKEYPIEMKPLLSAFGLRTFALTSLRSFLMFYLPLLEPRSIRDEDDDDFLQEAVEEQHVDLIVPLKKSIKQIVRETTVVTTRRLLERLCVHYISRRMAWKLLKDVPKSARRKAIRGMPTSVYFYSVAKTTFRGHLLGVAATWIVQVGIELYRCFRSLINKKEEIDMVDYVDKVDNVEQLRFLGRRISGVTIRCGSSLIFASIGAGIGATLIHPSTGQWIGCAAGDLAGPIIIGICVEKLFHSDL